MKAVIAIVLIIAVAVNGGVYTATSQIHGVALHAPLVAAPQPILTHAAIVPAAHSTSYKYRAPAAKILATPVVHAPVVHAPLVHHPVVMSHGVLLH